MVLKFYFVITFSAFFCHLVNHAADVPDPGTCDSLLAIIDTTTDGHKRVNAYNELSWDCVYTNTEQAITYARAALSEARELNFTVGESTALNRIGVAFDVSSKYDSALKYYHSALTISRKLNDSKLIAGNLCNIGLTNWHIGNSSEASRYFFSSLSYFEKDKNYQGIASTYNNIGMVYQSLKNYNKAATFFSRAHKYYSMLHYKPGIAATLTNLGQTYILKRDFEKAMKYLSESKKLKEEIEDYYGLAITYNLISSLYLETSNYKEALENSYKSAEYARLINNNNELASSFLKTAFINISKKDYRQALEYNRKAEDIAVSLNSHKLFYEVYHNYSEIFEATGDFKRSLDYFKRYKSAEDSVLNVRRYNQIYELELKRETDKNNAEIAILNKQKQFQLLQLEAQKLLISKRNNQILFTITGTLLIFLIIYLFYLKYKHKQKTRLEEAIFQIKQQRANEVIEAELRERKRIGEELHDGLGQVLSVLKLTLTSLQRKLLPEQQKQLELAGNAVELTDNAFNELRSISHNLAPIFLKEKGMVASIRNLLDKLNESKKYKVNMDFSGIEQYPDSYTELTIYRVIQEIINNIINHSSATEINFQLLQSGKELMVMVEDNGKGFEVEKLNKNKGIGLRNITSRIENIGGKVHIDSVINRGTIITIIVPQKEIKDEKIQFITG